MSDLFSLLSGAHLPVTHHQSITHPPAITPEVAARLERLRNFRTRYEIEIVRPDGARALLCYSEAISISAIKESVHRRAAEVLWFLGAGQAAEMDRKRGDRHITITGGGIIRKSGRTQRDAILGGELPFITTMHREAGHADAT